MNKNNMNNIVNLDEYAFKQNIVENVPKNIKVNVR